MSTPIPASRRCLMIRILLFLWITGTKTIFATPLLEGRYETTVDVEELLQLALDVADMKETTNDAEKLEIYSQGVVRNGVQRSVTLQSLSLNAGETMAQSPFFLFFQHAFLLIGQNEEHETEGLFDGRPISQYADTLVYDLMELADSPQNIEAEAVLVTSVWMACVHELFQVLQECKANNSSKGIAALDRAAALWIGANQEEGSNDRSALYNLAENAGQRFGQEDRETLVNTRLIREMNQLQSEWLASNSQTCQTEAGIKDVRQRIRRMIGIMTVPLVQNFIHYAKSMQISPGSEYSRFVKLYALAIVPRVAVCDLDAYQQELHLEVLRSLEANQVPLAIETLQKTYDCLEISCADVGSYLNGQVPECQDPLYITLAGYNTERPRARSVAVLDRDIQAIDIFLRFEAYGTALDWYSFGWNSQDYSLQQLTQFPEAASTSSPNLPQMFRDYYGGDTEFADNMIQNVLDIVPPYNSATKEQIRNLVNGLLIYVVVFVASASRMEDAVGKCGNGDEALASWDDGAKLYIGSMEGSGGDLYGSPIEGGGQSLFTTAKELCGEFGTCSFAQEDSHSIPVAAANDKMIKAFQDGIAALKSGSCDVVRKILDEQVFPTMTIPLIQGTVKYASYNADLQAGTDDSSLAIGDAFARGILPIVALATPSAAITIQSNMEFQLSTKPVPDGFSVVASAFREALKDLPTPCNEVGVFEDEPTDGNMCGNDGGSGVIGNIDNLAWGRYEFSNPQAIQDANFAFDVRDMYEGTLENANVTYREGKNNLQTGLYHDSDIRTLSAMNTDLSGWMIGNPLFSVYMFALYDEDDLDPWIDYTFGDDVVNEALRGASDNQLAAKASVVLNVFLYIVAQLYEAIDECSNNDDPHSNLDSAVALWIGREQKEGMAGTGWMLYAVAQEAARVFGFAATNEAAVNTELMELFQGAKKTVRDSCGTDNGLEEFSFQIHEIVRVLSKSLILAFLSLIYTGSNNMVELYAVSVLPQAVACDETVGFSLEKVFVNNFSPDKITDQVLDDLAGFLRCQRITIDDLETGPAVDDETKNLLTSLQSRLDFYENSTNLIALAGYTPSTDVSEIARLDLDALLIKVMIAAGASSAARDVFENGRNAYSPKGKKFLTLKSVFTGPSLQNVAIHQFFVDFYGTTGSSETVVEDLLMEVVDQSGENRPSSSLPRAQLAEQGLRTLQGVVSFLGVFAKLDNSISSCNEENTEIAQSEWDGAVALFVGSSEGPLAGGRRGSGGPFMYSISEEICEDFGDCGPSFETPDNANILASLSRGRDAVRDGHCDFLRRTVRNDIVSQISSLLVKALVAFTGRFQSGNDTAESLAASHAFAKALLPLVNQINTTSANALNDMYNNIDQMQSTVSRSTMVTSLAYVLRGMGIDCRDIGAPVNLPQFSLCLAGSEQGDDDIRGNVPNQPPLPDTDTELGDGIYTSSTYVQEQANIAKDVAEIEEALGSNSFNLGKIVYEDGKNSAVFDENGMFKRLRSLQSFSTEETLEMLDEPLFNMFLYSLGDDKGQFMSRDARLYADSLVKDAFGNASSGDRMLPAEGILAHNLWMHLAHMLYESLEDCRKKEIHNKDGVHSVDIAAAYWIGDGQVAGSGDDGHLLYAMAERMGEVFNLIDDGKSRTNRNILNHFNEAKHEMTLPGVCSDSPSSYLRLSKIANSIISLMAVPLIQHLIHALREGDRPRVQLYSYSVVPLLAGCGSGNFEYLKEKLLSMSYNALEIDDVIGAIRSSYPCLGLTCEDIGIHETEMDDADKQCKSPEFFASLAGYNPASDVGEFARLDLDMQQLDILLRMKAYSAADSLYTHGKHVKGVDVDIMSLHNLATTDDRKLVPKFDAFVDYYGNKFDEPSFFADHVIRAALENTGEVQWSDAQRRRIVMRSAQTMVVYFGAIKHLFKAVAECEKSSASDDITGYWDRGAAILIGSLEGTEHNGTSKGFMFFDLSQELCFDFGTCRETVQGHDINDDLITLLYSGRGAALSNGCGGIRKAANDISYLLLIPLIQGTLRSAIRLSQSADDDGLDRADAYVFSRAILPLVANQNSGAAQTIDKNLGFPGPASTRRTASEVFSAFATVYPKMGIDCKLIGTIDGSDPCDGVVYDDGIGRLLGIVLGSVVGACLLLGVGAFYLRKRKSQSRLPENNPNFVVTESGELNHSMDLLQKVFTSGRVLPNSGETVALAEDGYNDAAPLEEDDDYFDDEVTALRSNRAGDII